MNRYWRVIIASIRVMRNNAKVRHWLVKGPGYVGVHGYFDQIVDTIEDFEDYITEACLRYTDPNDLNAIPRTFEECETESQIPQVGIRTSIDDNLRDQIRDFEIMRALVEGAISKGVFDQAVTSGITGEIDKLGAHKMWLVRRAEWNYNIEPIILDAED